MTRARIAVALRLALGAVFVYAAVAKLPDPRALAVDIANYRVVPAALIPLLAVALPGVELVCGGCLLAGRHARAAALVAAGMLAVFTAAVAQALARGIQIECGCFGAARDPVTAATLARDVALLALAGAVLWLSPAGAPARAGAVPPAGGAAATRPA